MQSYEYKVIPAPTRGEKERGVKTGIERFAHTLSHVMNELGRDGWEYWRAETLPAEERSGLTSKTTVFHNLLVFRRPLSATTKSDAFVLRTEPPASPLKKALSAFSPEGRAPRVGPAEDED